MKKILLIIALFTSISYSQFRVSEMDSIITLVNTDLFWVNHDIGSSTFGHRQLSWNNLKTNTRNYLLGSNNTWTKRQTFSSGATFSSASYGTITFLDSVTTTGLWTNWLHRNTSTAMIGELSAPFLYIYARNFVTVNSTGTDSVVISFDGTTLNIDTEVKVADLQITNELSVPDSAIFTGIALSQTEYAPSFVTDSVVTLSNIASSVEIRPPGSMSSPGIEKIVMTKAGDGQVLVVTNAQSFTMVFQDNESDGNLYLAGDFSMGQWGSLTLMYNSKKLKWIELSRSNN